MSRLRKQAVAVALFAMIFVTSSAIASPRGDDSLRRGFGSRVKSLIVRILDDIRATFPPG
jgi:phage baseplate assembly protein W